MAVEAIGVAADDHRHCPAPFAQSGAQAPGHRGDVLDEAALGQERAHQQALDDPARRQLACGGAGQRADCDRPGNDEGEQQNAGEALVARAGVVS